MTFSEVIDKSIYAAQAFVALFGAFYVILMMRRIAQKRFASRAAADEYLEDVRARLQQRDFHGVGTLSDSPAYWSKAVPQLVLVALQNRDRGIAKVRRILAERFEHEVLADLEYGTSWIATLVKVAPMLGLLGTVVGMINAFAKIAAAQQSGVDPSQLAYDISFALITTEIGLFTAIPLVMCGNVLHVRIGKLQDAVQQDLGTFLDDFEKAITDSGRQAS
jgi:biopolymer transport protein ExbB/TolQ